MILSGVGRNKQNSDSKQEGPSSKVRGWVVRVGEDQGHGNTQSGG